MDAAVDAALGVVYVTNRLSGTVSVIKAATGTVTATIPVGNEPGGVAVDPSAGTVYVTNQGDNTVSVIDTATSAVKAAVAVGAGPFQVAVNPATHIAYVTDFSAGTVSVISGPLLGLGFPAPPPGRMGVAYSDTLSAGGGVGAVHVVGERRGAAGRDDAGRVERGAGRHADGGGHVLLHRQGDRRQQPDRDGGSLAGDHRLCRVGHHPGGS